MTGVARQPQLLPALAAVPVAAAALAHMALPQALAELLSVPATGPPPAGRAIVAEGGAFTTPDAPACPAAAAAGGN